MKTAGRWLMIIGGLLILLGIGLGIYSGAKAVDVATSFTGEMQPFDGTTTVSLAAGDGRGVYSTSGSSGTCDVKGPGGQPVSVTSTRSSQDINTGSERYWLVADFKADAAGQYTVRCDGSGMVLGPSVLASGVVGAALGLVGAFGAGGLGLLMLIIGLILYFVGRGRERTASPYGYGGPGGYPGYQQGGYPQQGSYPPPPGYAGGPGQQPGSGQYGQPGYGQGAPPPPPPGPRPEDNRS